MDLFPSVGIGITCSCNLCNKATTGEYQKPVEKTDCKYISTLCTYIHVEGLSVQDLLFVGFFLTFIPVDLIPALEGERS
jgi:hypothetical protein